LLLKSRKRKPPSLGILSASTNQGFILNSWFNIIILLFLSKFHPQKTEIFNDSWTLDLLSHIKTNVDRKICWEPVNPNNPVVILRFAILTSSSDSADCFIIAVLFVCLFLIYIKYLKLFTLEKPILIFPFYK
jgi:hypothetical protein